MTSPVHNPSQSMAFSNPPEIANTPVLERNKTRKPGWYWVLTSMKHRSPFKKWVALEWFYEPHDEKFGEFPYHWLHGEQEEMWNSKILDVIETPIPLPVV